MSTWHFPGPGGSKKMSDEYSLGVEVPNDASNHLLTPNLYYNEIPKPRVRNYGVHGPSTTNPMHLGMLTLRDLEDKLRK